MTEEVNRYRNKKYPAVYCSIYPMLTDIANSMGYALAINGSLTHDMDLIAIPWIEDAKPQRDLVDAFLSNFKGSFVHEVGKVGEKPHGRKAYTLFLDGHAYIDLSIMPRTE